MAERLGVLCFGRKVLFVCLIIFLRTVDCNMLDTNTTALNETTETFDGPLPVGWGKFCSLINTSLSVNRLDYRCIIDKESSGMWRLDVLRPWINSSDYSFTMDISCIDGANISLPWPMKARNLVEVKVKNCIVEDYFADHSNTFLITIPDQLDILELSNIVIMIRLSSMAHIAPNVHKMEKDYQCGSEDTLVRYVSSNISYDFHPEIFIELMNSNASDPKFNIMDIGSKFISNTRDIPYNCVYKRLKYYDQSISKSKAKMHMELSTDKVRYPELRFYNLSMTGINKVHEQIQKWYHFFKKLEHMDLSSNYITELQFDDTARAYKDQFPDFKLDLSNNKISALTASHLHRLARIPNLFINLTGNPINCTCSDEVKQLLNVIHDPKIWKNASYARYEHWKTLECHWPQGLSGRSLISVKEAELPCEVELEYVVNYGAIVGLSVFALFLIAVIIVLAKFRREIRILTYTRFNIILPCQNVQLYENKRYDAFVSYSSADQEWVSKTFEFIENSENNLMRQFRFCLHHRDFIPGKTIFDNVIDSVESSRHTVIVLSRNFLNSHYCMYEFHEAFQQSIIERKKHLIVILLEEIPTGELPNDLKRCLKTFTYIRKDDIIFEDRLVFALSYKGTKHRTESESTSKSVTSQISRETDVTSVGNMSPSIISTDSVFPPIITTDDFIKNKEKSENHV